MYNVTKDLYFTGINCINSILNIANNKKCYMSTKLAYYIIFLKEHVTAVEVTAVENLALPSQK